MYLGWIIAYVMKVSGILALLLGIWLIYLSNHDQKQLWVKASDLYVCVFIAFLIWLKKGCVLESMLFSILIPLLLHLYNTYRQYAIGNGDVILIWISCWMFGLNGVCFILLIASWCAGVFVLMNRKKGRIAFMPFLSIAIQVCLITNYF